jgi:hypothetical protein
MLDQAPKVNFNLPTKTSKHYPIECHAIRHLDPAPDANQKVNLIDECFIEMLRCDKGRSVVVELGIATATMWSVIPSQYVPILPTGKRLLVVHVQHRFGPSFVTYVGESRAFIST